MTDLDPLLHDAMARIRGPVNARPSLGDVRRRARRRNLRRMGLTAGAVACAGLATTAVVVRSAATQSGTASHKTQPSATSPVVVTSSSPPTTIYPAPTLTIDATSVWYALRGARTDPSGVALDIGPADLAAAKLMPTPQQFGCTTEPCLTLYNYVLWHEMARLLGFVDVYGLQEANPGVDFSQPPQEGDVLQSNPDTSADPGVDSTVAPGVTPNGVNETPTTISLYDGVMLVDAGAPAGALEDAYGRLNGYNRTIVPGSGKTVAQTELMPIGDNAALATAVGGLLGLDGFDTWDPSFLATPIQGMVAVMIGPDYFDRVQNASSIITVATSTSLG